MTKKEALEVLGKRAGIHGGERSSLFFEAIRIIKEMRAAHGDKPRFAIWENVPGARSSNGGEDFRAVLQAFAGVKGGRADVPRPKTGRWGPAGAILGDGWSLAWRTYDAKYWGVPQRRKRIFHTLQDPINGEVAPCMGAQGGGTIGVFMAVQSPTAGSTAYSESASPTADTRLRAFTGRCRRDDVPH